MTPRLKRAATSSLARTAAALVLSASAACGLVPGSSSTSTALSTTASTKGCGSVAKVPHRWEHVIWIWFENKSYHSVVGSSAAPYLNRLAGACGLATNYRSIAHPSLPNYLAATSGSTHNLHRNCLPRHCAVSGVSIFGQSSRGGRSWRAYAESMPTPCDRSNAHLYGVRHNPPAYYSALGSGCARHDIPFGSSVSGAFARDVTSGTLPSFAFVTPNLCHDMHDCSVLTGDLWLATWLPRIVAGKNYRAGKTAVFVTFDEGKGSDNFHVATFVVAPTVHVGTRSAAAFSHYSLLRTTEEMLGLPLLGAARQAPSMRGAFRL